jgi:hypothetical protein
LGQLEQRLEPELLALQQVLGRKLVVQVLQLGQDF